MISILLYFIVAVLGFFLAEFLSRPPELRPLRLSQLVFVPMAMMAAVSFLPRPGQNAFGQAQNFISYIGVAGFLALLLAPNLAHYCGVAFINLVDPQDWTPSEEEIALRPVQRLIDRDKYEEALSMLDTLLKEHKPTYEALLLKTRLLHHLGWTEDTVSTLLQMLPLSKSADQQLAVMEALVALENQFRRPSKLSGPASRTLQIKHELLLVPIGGRDLSEHREIPPGVYEVETSIEGNHRWLKLAGETWGNFEVCWEAVQQPGEGPRPAMTSSKGFLGQIARMHESISLALSGESRLREHAEARQHLKEANNFIRREEWSQALPLLQKASACDPHCYEIAYRLVQATRRCGGEETAKRTIRRVLNQSRWTEDEQTMLQR